jgi:hypothetical protein
VRRPRWIPPGNLPRGRGINPAELAKRSTKRTRKPAERVIEDGFGWTGPKGDGVDDSERGVR